MSIFKWFISRRKEDSPEKEAKHQEIYLKVKKVLLDKLDLPTNTDISFSTKLIDDLGVDSLDIVELVMELEEKFGIEIPDEDTEMMRTVKDIVDYIEKELINGKK